MLGEPRRILQAPASPLTQGPVGPVEVTCCSGLPEGWVTDFFLTNPTLTASDSAPAGS